jgi:peptide/nickel transport system substrate-binding protein
MSLSRRSFLAGTAAATTAVALRAPNVHAQKRGGTLRFVPHADLKIVDPIWTTAYITRNHGYMIFDTLFALDADLKLRPQMVDKFTVSRDALKYSFTLRDGLKFHDGQPVTAEDCVASLKRWGARDAVGRLMMASLSKMVPVDRKTFTIDLEQPFGLVLDALGKPSASPSFIMPARVAATDPNEQIKEVIGSGPFKFAKDDWQPGNRVVYLRNADYVPRNETPSGAAGAKRPLVDRVEWRYIPDAATAGAALEAGEVDYWENVPLDFAPRLEKNTDLRVFVTDPRGSQGILRPNHLHPPFNNKKARQALLLAVDQKNYLQAVIGHEKYYKTCQSVFMCGGLPYETAAGFLKPDLERARALFKESGYDGRPLVILDPADSPYAHAPALVTMEMLKSLGANVDLQSMDWSTMVARRAKKEAPAQGGWNVFHTWSTSFDTMTPAVSSVLGGGGEKAWFGWPTSEPMEKLRADFAREPNEAKRKAIAEKVQLLAYDEVPYVPWGQFVVPGAFRKNVQGVLQFGATLLWNIQV